MTNPYRSYWPLTRAELMEAALVRAADDLAQHPDVETVERRGHTLLATMRPFVRVSITLTGDEVAAITRKP